MTRLKISDVTIVIPTIGGRSELLNRALASVGRLERPPGDVRIVADTERRGAAWARNEGLRQTRTALVAWLDDDDELLPNHLKVLVRALADNRADMAFSYAQFVGVDGQGRDGHDPLACCWHGRLVPAPINVPFGPEQRAHLDARVGAICRYCGYERGNFIPVTYLVRTELMREVGGMPEPYSMGQFKSGDCEDYLALLRMLDAGADIHHVPGVRTWRYHYHDGNLGGRGVNRMSELEDQHGEGQDVSGAAGRGAQRVGGGAQTPVAG